MDVLVPVVAAAGRVVKGPEPALPLRPLAEEEAEGRLAALSVRYIPRWC
jgi:hypothetical protein